MQETRSNCFGSKIFGTALSQVKTGRYKCRNITAIYMSKYMLLYLGIRAYLFSPDEVSCHIFSTKKKHCCEFLASNGVFIQSVIHSFLKTPCASLSCVCIDAKITVSLKKKKERVMTLQNIKNSNVRELKCLTTQKL